MKVRRGSVLINPASPLLPPISYMTLGMFPNQCKKQLLFLPFQERTWQDLWTLFPYIFLTMTLTSQRHHDPSGKKPVEVISMGGSEERG